ncbi:MAG TPA: hypothetical protein VKU41_26350 [Polyangiaceae bacterium]|nr:hypothetical protein [Polyangiaceae bacterium]
MIRSALLVLIEVGAGCAGAPARVDGVHDDAAVRPDASVAVVDAAPAPPEHPFAASPAEAQRIIEDQIETRVEKLWRCVETFRAEAGAAHQTIAVEIGIDQEGHLLGVASADGKHPLFSAMKDCMIQVLRTAIFPRSHSGVIAVRQTFKDTAVYR